MTEGGATKMEDRERAWLHGVLSGLDQGIPPEEGMSDEAARLTAGLATAALRQDASAAFKLASENPVVVNRNKQSAALIRALVDALGVGVETGHAECASQLGTMYFLGMGVPTDHDRARQLYERASELGSAQGSVNLAYLYYYGRGVPEDLPRAYKLFARAALTANHPEALWKIGDMYRTGRFVEQDDLTAFTLYSRAYGITRKSSMRARPAHHMADYLLRGIPGHLDQDPRAALALYCEAEIGYYDQIDAGLSYYRPQLEQCLEGQAEARRGIARNRVGRRFRFDDL